MKQLLILLALAASAQQIKINPITGLPDLVGSSSASAVSSVTAGPTGALRCTPTTGAVVCDVDTLYVPNKTGSNTWTGTNDFTGGSLLIPGLSTVGAVPYVSSSGVLAQDGSFLRTATGKYTIQNPTAITGDTQVIIKEGAGQSSNIFLVQDASGNTLLGALGTNAKFASTMSNTGNTVNMSATQGMLVGTGLQYLFVNGFTYDSPDTGLARNAAGVVEVNNGTAGTLRDFLARQYKNTPVAVGSLQTCNAGNAGSVASVNDSLAPAWGVTVANGGAAYALVTCNGANWTVTGI